MDGKMALTKGDILIIALVLLTALGGFFMPAGWQPASAAGLSAEIYVEGQLREIVALADSQREMRLESGGNGYNLLRITPEGITMLAADCHNQDCLHAGTQDKPGAMIACLPHRVLVRLIDSSGNGGVDAIAY